MHMENGYLGYRFSRSFLGTTIRSYLPRFSYIYIYIYPRVGYDPLQDKEAELENFQWILEFLIKKKMGGKN